jgi:hypothetical protein
LEGRTSNSRNGRAWASLLAGLVAAAALPGAIAVSQELRTFKLLNAFAAIPVAALFGWIAIRLARGARARVELTLGRARGRAIARFGRLLGLVGVYLAVTGLLTVAVYLLLSRFVAR